MRDEVPKWCWYNGQLLFALSERLVSAPNTSISEFMREFKEAQQLNHVDFNLKNQGLLISLMYGLLVLPKEMWEPKGTKTNFAFKTRKNFSLSPYVCFSTDDFLRLLRNAVAHANFEVIIEQSKYRFWNTTPKGDRNFDVTITHGGLGEFVAEIGKYFINQARSS